MVPPDFLFRTTCFPSSLMAEASKLVPELDFQVRYSEGSAPSDVRSETNIIKMTFMWVSTSIEVILSNLKFRKLFLEDGWWLSLVESLRSSLTYSTPQLMLWPL